MRKQVINTYIPSQSKLDAEANAIAKQVVGVVIAKGARFDELLGRVKAKQRATFLHHVAMIGGHAKARDTRQGINSLTILPKLPPLEVKGISKAHRKLDTRGLNGGRYDYFIQTGTMLVSKVSE